MLLSKLFATFSSIFVVVEIFLSIPSNEAIDSQHQSYQPPIFSPCGFPIPSDEAFFQYICRPNKDLTFLCDIHHQIENLNPIFEVYRKHKQVFHVNGSDLIGLIVVKQLAQPVSTNSLVPESEEFGCLFSTPCFTVTDEQLDKFVNNFKFFTKAYTSILFRRWFFHERCPHPRILALVVTDGVVSDARKLTTVVFYTDNSRLKQFISNIQLEATNSILRGTPLVESIADMLDQIGFAYRDYHITGGIPRQHGIPAWAFQLSGIFVLLVIVAMSFEWCIVRRKILVNRSHSGMNPAGAARSKTHLIF